MPYTPANPFDTMFSGGFRSYNGAPINSQSMTYALNPYYRDDQGHTGQLQLLTTDNQGALRVNIGTGINISATITGTNVTVENPIAVTGGQIDVNGFATLTGQINTLNAAVATLTGSVQWNKVKTAGYATVFGAVTGSVLVNKVLGYSKTAVVPGFIQLFDLAAAPTPGAIPDFVCATQPNNWFLDLAENGVRFTSGLQVANSLTADVYTTGAAADFTASVIYKL